MICGIFGDKSLSEPRIGVIRFRLLSKNPPEGRQKNRLLQDLEIFDRKAHGIKPQLNGQKKNQNRTRENNARSTLEIRRASGMPRKVTNRPTRTVQAGRNLVQVIGLKLKRKDGILHS